MHKNYNQVRYLLSEIIMRTAGTKNARAKQYSVPKHCTWPIGMANHNALLHESALCLTWLPISKGYNRVKTGLSEVYVGL